MTKKKGTEGAKGAEGSKEQEYLDGWKRALADYENLKKNIAGEKEEDRKRIKKSLAYELLPVMDNFEQAALHAPELDGSHRSWLDGVLYIKKQFEDVFASLGIEPITELAKFDPSLHEASGEESDAEKEEGAIIRVLQTGWKMGDVVLRPAKVIVNHISKAPNPSADSQN